MKRVRIYLIAIFCLASLSLNRAMAGEELTWQACVREAAKNHPDLIAAEAEVKQSEAEKKITASALFPQVNADLSASTSATPSRTARGDLTKSISDSYSYGGDAQQLIFDGFKTLNDVKAAAENIKAARQNFRFASVDVRLRLRTAFINLLRAQEALKITWDIFEIRRGNFELITLRYESGLEHKGALLTAEANLADAKYGIAQAKRELEVAQRQLIKEMGRAQLTSVKAEGDFRVADSARVKPDFEQLIKDNPSLLQIAAQKNAAQYGIKSAYANFYPTLSGTAGAGKLDSKWAPKGNQWDLGLNLSLPIFEGGLRTAQVSQAKALFKQLQENERSARDAAILALEQTWAALQDAVDNVVVQEKFLLANEVRARIAEGQYSIGYITFDNWTIIQDNLVRSKGIFLDAEADALLTEANWVQAKGEVLEYD